MTPTGKMTKIAQQKNNQNKANHLEEQAGHQPRRLIPQNKTMNRVIGTQEIRKIKKNQLQEMEGTSPNNKMKKTNLNLIKSTK